MFFLGFLISPNHGFSLATVQRDLSPLLDITAVVKLQSL